MMAAICYIRRHMGAMCATRVRVAQGIFAGNSKNEQKENEVLVTLNLKRFQRFRILSCIYIGFFIFAKLLETLFNGAQFILGRG